MNISIYKYILYLGLSRRDVKKLVGRAIRRGGAEIELTRNKIVHRDEDEAKRLLATFGLIERG